MPTKRKVRRDSTKQLHEVFDRTTGCDVDKEIVVIANYSRDLSEIKTVECKQNERGLKKAIDYITAFGSQLVILESTANYHLLFYDGFKAAGLNVEVINPTTVKALLRVEGKNDKADAITLARLASSFALRTSNMPDAIQRQIRLYLRNLDKIKQDRTRILNRVQSTLASFGITVYNVTKVNSVSGLAILKGICDGKPKVQIIAESWKGSEAKVEVLLENFGDVTKVPEYARDLLLEMWENILLLNDSITFKEATIPLLIDRLGLSELVELMLTLPAMTPTLALRILGEMGTNFPNRYSSNEKFVKAIGVCPDNKVSGGKVLKKQSSHGNKHVKIHLCNAVKAYCVTHKRDNEVTTFFRNYKARATFKKAVSAVARKLMVSLYAMVKNDQPYQPRPHNTTHEEIT